MVACLEKSFRHGINGYIRHKCRCDICVKTRQEYLKKRSVAKIFKHGVGGYLQCRCRCAICKGAWARYVRKYRAGHPDKAKTYRERYKLTHPEKIAEGNRRKIERHKQFKAANPEEYRKKVNESRLANLDSRRRKDREYMNKRRQEDLNFRLRCNLRSRVVNSLHHNSKSARTMELIGCSIEELQEYLKSKFKLGMSWDNYGEWHIDHIKPCVSFDLLNPEEQRKCFHYTNLQPLWAHENLIKSDKMEACA